MRNRIRFVSTSILVVSLALLIVSFVTSRGGRTSFGSDLGADYAGFYTAGWILNHRPAVDLYDRDVQDRIHHELHPQLRPEEELPYVYPPFVAVAFQPLARLPYAWSFGVWLVISLGLYLTGLLVLVHRLPVARTDRLTVLLAALSFEPFVMECWQGGQVSAFGFCCMVVAWDLDRRPARRFASGLVLGLCLYKPTLLLVIIPILVVAGRWRNLLGIGVTGAALGLLTVATVGLECSMAFVDKLLAFSQSATQVSALELRTWKYVDLNAFTRLLLGGPGPAQKILFIAVVLPTMGLILLRAFSLNEKEDQRSLLWAIAYIATPVLNLYVGIYDSVIVVPGALLLVDVLSRPKSELSMPLRCWLAAVYVAPWLTQPLARTVQIQVFSLVLLGLTWWTCLRMKRAVS